jgi:hypothetical protein
MTNLCNEIKYKNVLYLVQGKPELLKQFSTDCAAIAQGIDAALGNNNS